MNSRSATAPLLPSWAEATPRISRQAVIEPASVPRSALRRVGLDGGASPGRSVDIEKFLSRSLLMLVSFSCQGQPMNGMHYPGLLVVALPNRCGSHSESGEVSRAFGGRTGD